MSQAENSGPSTKEIEAAHRRLAIDCNNEAWTLAEKPQRSDEESEQMVHIAHAAAWHWSKVGTAANESRADHLLAYVYYDIGSAERCLAGNLKHDDLLEDWDLAFAYHVMACAEHLAGDTAQRDQWLSKAKTAGDAIERKQDAEIFFAFLNKTPGYEGNT